MKIIELLKKEYLMFKRNKKQIWIVLLLPLIFSLIYVFMYSMDNINIDIAICNLDSGEYSQSLINGLSDSFSTKIVNGDSLNECSTEIQNSIISGSMLGIIIQDSFTQEIHDYNQPTLQLYFDNSKPNLGFFAQSYLINNINGFNNDVLRSAEQTIKDNTYVIENELSGTLNLLAIMNGAVPDFLVETYDEVYSSVNEYYEKIKELNSIDLEFLVKPVKTQLIGIFQGSNSEGFTFSVLYTVLNIIVILLLSSVSIVNDKKSAFFTRLKTSTTPIIYYIISKLILFVAIGILIFIPAFLVFTLKDAYFNINIITTIVSLILISSISSLIGCIIGLSSKNEATSIMVSIFIGFIFLLLSGLFYPIDLLPEMLKIGLNVLPTSADINILNNALVFNTSLKFVSQIVNQLLLYILLFGVSTYYLIVKNG